jgi:hypothetical protein
VPAQHRRARSLTGRSPRAAALPMPGIGGWAYPRGPFGATGFPGSTPAARPVHTQGPSGRKDPSYQGRPTVTATGIRAQWTGPEFNDPGPVEVPKPQPSYSRVRFRPGIAPQRGNPVLDPSGAPRGAPARLMALTTGPEHRMSPVFEVPENAKNVRNSYAQDYKAVPGQIRPYMPAANPGKTGAHLDGLAYYHPTQPVHGGPDGKPIPGRPGPVVVQSRSVFGDDPETSSYYAMNRDDLFAKGGTPAPYPPWYRGDRHIRGGRYTGQRYFGDMADQQKIGLPTDAYGISRARGPRHRPTRFEQPQPWSSNYYDTPAPAGATAPDMIYQSPSTPSNRSASTLASTPNPAPSRLASVVSALTGGTLGQAPAPAAPTRRSITTSLRGPSRG